MSLARAALTLALTVVSACAQIQTTSRVEIHPQPQTKTLVIGSPASVIKARGAAAQWTQDGAAMQFEVSVTRECAVLRHEPVLRVETITKRSGGALYWEFGLGGLLLAGGLVGLIRPDLFGQRAIDTNGQATRDKAAGYRIGGILTGLSAVAIGAGVWDLLRTRDEVHALEAFRPKVGEAAQCDKPAVPLTGRTIEIIVGEWSQQTIPDADGIARFALPPAGTWPNARTPDAPTTRTVAPPGGYFDAAKIAAATPASEAKVDVVTAPDGTPQIVPQARLVPGVLRLGGRAALRFDFVVPYDAPAAKGHTGVLVVEPQPVRRAPPRPKAVAR